VYVVLLATLEYVECLNHRRLHGKLGWFPPVDFEARYHERAAALTSAPSQ
jgi:transposase InsO family protein